MTAVLSYIMEYCIRNNIPVIVVQSVQTYEMMQFCLKNKFIASPYNSMFEGVLMGDYILRISDFQAESTEMSRM